MAVPSDHEFPRPLATRLLGGDSRAEDVGIHDGADDRYRMEAKGLVRRVKKVGNFHVFEAVITREAAQRRLIDDVLT